MIFKIFFILIILFNCATANYNHKKDNSSQKNLKNISYHIGYNYYLNGKPMDFPLNNQVSDRNFLVDFKYIENSLLSNENVEFVSRDNYKYENEIEIFLHFNEEIPYFPIFLSVFTFQIIPSYQISSIKMDIIYRGRRNGSSCNFSKKGRMVYYEGIFPLLFRPFFHPESTREEMFEHLASDVIIEITNNCLKE